MVPWFTPWFTLSSLLDQHAPVITKLSKRKSKSNPWFTTTVRRAENLWKRTHSATTTNPLKSLRNQYHRLILTSKNSISPTWSPRSLTIQSVCGKLLTIYFIAHLLHHYYLYSLAASITSSQKKFPNFISLSPAILLLHPHTHPPPN